MSPREERRKALREAIGDLGRYKSTWDLPAFLASNDARRMVQHAMYVAVQACVDEAIAACTEEGFEAGSRYRDSFLNLAKAGCLDKELAARLADWASFRNVLAHFYPVVDPRRVHAALDEVSDLAAFQRWLEARGS